MQDHAGIVGFRTHPVEVAAAEVVGSPGPLLCMAGALRAVLVVLGVHLAKVGQQRHLGLIAHVQGEVALGIGGIGVVVGDMAAVPRAPAVLGEAVAVGGGARDAAGVGVVETGAVQRVEVHLRHIDPGTVGARDRRVLHAGNHGIATQLQEIVFCPSAEQAFRIEVMVGEAVEHDVLAIIPADRRGGGGVVGARRGVLGHILPRDELHLGQVLDTVIPQHLLGDDQVALGRELVGLGRIRRVLEMVGQGIGGGNDRTIQGSVDRIGADGPRHGRGCVGPGPLFAARERDGAHRAMAEGVEQLVVDRHLRGVEAGVVRHRAAILVLVVGVQLQDLLIVHLQVDGHVHVVEGGSRMLVGQVRPHLEIAVIGHASAREGTIGAVGRVGEGVVVHVLVEGGAVLAEGVHCHGREVHLQKRIGLALLAGVVQLGRDIHLGLGVHLGELAGAVAAHIVVPGVRLTPQFHGELLVGAHVGVDLAVTDLDALQVEIALLRCGPSGGQGPVEEEMQGGEIWIVRGHIHREARGRAIGRFGLLQHRQQLVAVVAHRIALVGEGAV